jgi:hypothetical protein
VEIGKSSLGVVGSVVVFFPPFFRRRKSMKIADLRRLKNGWERIRSFPGGRVFLDATLGISRGCGVAWGEFRKPAKTS